MRGPSVCSATAQLARDLSARIGYLPEERGLYRKMRVLDQLVFLGEIRGLRRLDSPCDAPEPGSSGSAWGTGPEGRSRTSPRACSRRSSSSVALLHDPELVVLDEPFSGLDPVNSQVMKDVVVEIAREGRTVLFSTHIMEQAEQMCDRVAIIARGEKVLDGALSEVKRDFGTRHVALAFTRNQASAARVLRDPALVARADDYGAVGRSRTRERGEIPIGYSGPWSMRMLG